MRRLAWIVVAIGCGNGPQTTGADAGADVTGIEHPPCVVDFPCANPWRCVDSTHWVEMKSVSKPPCTGLTCESNGVTHACDPGLECVDDAPPGNSPPCSYGGHYACSPADVPTFSPQPIGPTPTKQPGACDSMATIAQFWSSCIDPTTSDTTQCTSLDNLHSSCGQCLIPTIMQSASLGDHGPNVGGCYALLDGTSAAGSCAALDDTNMQCAMISCAGCDPWPDDFTTCVLAARTTKCASYSICSSDAGASYATCEPTSMKDFFIAFGAALCGP